MKLTRLNTQFFLYTGLALALPSALAQTLPDAGSLIRDIAGSTQQNRPSATLPGVSLSGDETAQDVGTKVFVKSFHITRATIFPEDELVALLTDLVGKDVSLAQLQQAALRVSDFYRRRGFFARALLPKQVVQDGVVEILVLESTLGSVNLTEPYPQRAKAELALNTVLSQQKIGEPLKPDDVLTGLKLVNEIPGYAVTATLKSGASERETSLMLNLADTPLFNGMAILDNQGANATGSERALAALNINNPSGWGDQASLMGLASEGNAYLRAAYTVRLGLNGLRAGLNATALNYRLVGSFADLRASGTANIYGITLSYPLAKTNALNLNLSAALDNKRFVNDIADINISDKSVKTLGLSLSGDYLDGIGGSGLTQFSLGWVAGNTDLSANGNDLAVDQLTAKVQGSYRKLSFALARLQKLADRLGLYLSYSGQLTNRNLDSSEKFSLGGPNGVRAFPSGEGAGDGGWLLTAELRYNVSDKVQLFGFIDAGSLTAHQSTWIGWNDATPELPNSYSLSGAGVGLNWSGKDNLLLRAVASGRISNNPGMDANGKDSDGTRQNTRVWMQLIQPF